MAIAVTVETVIRRGQTDERLAQSLSFEGWEEREVTISAGATNIEVALAFTSAALKYLYIKSNETVTMETNDSGTPQETKTITADIPLEWQVNGGISYPFAGSVTKLFFNNAGADDATVIIKMGRDATP